MADLIFAKGVQFYNKNDKAPDFVIGSIVITPRDLLDWLSADGGKYLTDYKEKKQLRLQVKKSKDGKPMVTVDTWKPENRHSSSDTETFSEPKQTPQQQSGSNELPF